MGAPLLDRRTFLRRGAGVGLAALATLAEGSTPAAAAAARRPSHTATIPLPSAAQVRADFQRMVDFGPRYTGTAPHAAFVDWLEQELLRAGFPCTRASTGR